METPEPVAIIGIGCRFPGADGPNAFWRLLVDGVDAIREVPPDRWSIDEFLDEDLAVPGKMNTRWGGFLNDVERFDAAFFGISPREAAHIDPQQRLLMEVAWDALEDAGLPAEQLRGQPVGVFVGISSCDYGGQQLARVDQIRDGYVNTGSALSIAANRLSYFFDLRGPSIVFDTACSSSLVAAYYACQSLRHGESRVALAGGANLVLSPAVTVGFSKLQAMAPDGRCKAFDARANGYVRAEGAGIVVLKPLADAVADGDRIYAVIRGGAINQDGRTNGLTAPNGLSQEALLRDAFSKAGVLPSEVQYVEAHGTGTALGDPIELNALGAALAPGRSRDARCAVGSVKTNFGHLEAAAGVAGLIKLALSLQRRQLPPSLHFQKPNPYIRFEALPLRVVTRLEPWPADAGPARGGVSSFGFGGTNAHLILQEPPAAIAKSAACRSDVCVLPVSARTEEALASLARAYAARLAEAGDELSLSDLCFTAAVRRSHHDFRLAAVAGDRSEMASKLSAYIDGEHPREVEAGRKVASRRRKVAFVFPGQGSQWLGMGRELADREPVFHDAIQKCEAAFVEHVDWSLTAELHASPAESRLEEVDVIQPAIFAIQVALAALWKSWGIKPDAVVGHSMGEVAAAHVAGALSLEDAARIICLRSRLAKRTSGRGAMALVDLSLARSTDVLTGYEDRLAVAVSNSPTSTVLSGDPEALEEVLLRLEREGVFCRRIKVDYASHSPQMDPLRGDLLAVLQGIASRRTNVAMYSTVTAGICAGTDMGPEYWVRNLREPVLFAAVVEKLFGDGVDVFLEVSPHPILLPAIQQCLAHVAQDWTALASLRRDQGERRSLLATLASLYAIGKPVEWNRVYASGGECVALPSYPWQRERYWFDADEAEPARKARARANTRHPLLGDRIRLATDPSTHVWKGEIAADTYAFVKDHRVEGKILVPSTAYVEMALEAAADVLGAPGRFVLDDVQFEKPLELSDRNAREIQVVLSGQTASHVAWQVFTTSAGPAADVASSFVRHARGEIRVSASDGGRAASSVDWLDTVRSRCPMTRSGADHYQEIAKSGAEYGSSLHGIETIWLGDGEALARIKAAPSVARYRLDPAVLHAAIQCVPVGMSASSPHMVPTAIASIRVNELESAGGPLWAHATTRNDGAVVRADLRLLTDTGELVAELNGLTLMPAERKNDDVFYTVRWEKPADAVVAPPNGIRGRGFMIFADTQGTGVRVAERIAAAGGQPIVVTPGSQLEVPDDVLHGGPCRIDPARGDHYSSMLQEIARRGLALDSVLHLWTLDAGEDVNEACRLGAASVLLLTQALSSSAVYARTRLCLTTRGAQCVNAGDNASPFQAPVWGLARTIAQEHPELACTAIDLDPASNDGAAAALALEQELWRRDGDQQVALRGADRFVARLAAMDCAGIDSQGRAAIRDDSTYVLTGGLGGIALVVARWLVDQGARHLVLVGRRQPSAEAMEAIREMERAGAAVVVDRFDVADRGAVDTAFARWSRDLPPVRGILHAAGVLDDGIVLQQTPERFRRVMAAKVEGAWNLHRASEACPLDLFVLFSSAASVLGSAGQSNYAAANAFLDTLAHYRRARKQPAVSINWGPWSEVGLAARPDRGGRLEVGGIRSLSPGQGVEALDRVLRANPPQVVAMAADWAEWRRAHPAMSRLPFFSGIREASTPEKETADHPARVDVWAAAPDERVGLVANSLRAHAASVLRLPVSKVDLHQPLITMGIDSLMAVELKGRVEREIGMTIPLLQVIKGPSLLELARTLVSSVSADDAVRASEETLTPQSDGTGKSLLLSILAMKDKDPVETA